MQSTKTPLTGGKTPENIEKCIGQRMLEQNRRYGEHRFVPKLPLYPVRSGFTIQKQQRSTFT